MVVSTPVDPLENAPGYLLRRISVENMIELGRLLKPLQLRAAEATVLLMIEANRGITQVAVGRAVGVAAPNMVTLLARLLEREVIARQPLDGRSHGLYLTSRGQTLVRKVKKVMAAHEAAFLERIPASQRASVLAALRVLKRSAWPLR